MPTHVVFCSARDRMVMLAPRSSDWMWHLVLHSQPFGDVACLDQGRSCTGTLCPFCAESPTGVELEEASRLGTSRPS
ncbi:MAG: hypothetical protein WD737_04210 [Gemmatimonadota bacterium]